MSYRPSRADLRFRDAKRGGANPFETARLLRDVSYEYLSVLIHDNAGDKSLPFRIMVEAELARRGTRAARRANMIAMLSMAIAAASLVVAIYR